MTRDRWLYNELTAYSIHQPLLVRYAPNHWHQATAPVPSPDPSFPSETAEWLYWLEQLNRLGYGARRNAIRAVDRNRIARRYAQLAGPPRPALPGDLRMLQPGIHDETIWATDFGWQRMWSTATGTTRPPVLVDNVTEVAPLSAAVSAWMADLLDRFKREGWHVMPNPANDLTRRVADVLRDHPTD